jgi:hypothetical protein
MIRAPGVEQISRVRWYPEHCLKLCKRFAPVCWILWKSDLFGFPASGAASEVSTGNGVAMVCRWSAHMGCACSASMCGAAGFVSRSFFACLYSTRRRSSIVGYCFQKSGVCDSFQATASCCKSFLKISLELSASLTPFFERIALHAHMFAFAKI